MLTNDKNRKIRKQSAYVMMLIYFCVFTLIVAIGFSFFLYGSNRLYNSIRQSNQYVAQQYARTIDRQLQRLALMSYELRNDIDIRAIAQADNVNSTLMMSVYKHLEKSASHLYKYELISDYMIYFHRSEFVMTSTGAYNARWYFDHLVKDEDATYEEWQAFLLGHDLQMRYYASNSTRITHTDIGQHLLSVRSLGIQRAQTVMVVKVPAGRLAQIAFMPNISSESVVTLYLDNLPVVSSNPDNFTPKVIQPGDFVTETADIQYSSAKVSSMRDGWIVYELPFDSLVDRILRSYEQIRFILMVLLIIGVVVTFIFAYIVAKPIDRIYLLIRNMRSHGDGAFESVNLASLEKTFSQMMQKQQETENELYKAKYSAGQSYFYNLLNESTELTQTHLAQLATYGYPLPYDYVIVFLCFARKTSPEPHYLFEQIIGFLHTEAQSTLQHFVIETDERTSALIINTNHQLTNTEQQTLIRKLDQTLSGSDSPPIYVAIGPPQPVRSLSLSFQAAKEALAYRFLYPDVHVFTQSIVVNDSDAYYYPTEIEHKIASCVMKHDGDALDKLVDDLFRINFTEKQLDVYTAYLFLFALTNTAYRLGGKRQDREDASEGHETDPVKWIGSVKDVNDAKNHLLYLYSTLINRSLSNDNSKDKMIEWRTRKIIEYIQSHYLDADLSLTQVADHFRVTPQYLSSIFKSNLDENFSIYVQKLRLEKAQALMNDSQLTLNRIAEQSGFGNYLSLSRAFQKHMGISPGAYRQIKHIG